MLIVGNTYTTRSGHSVVIIEHRPGQRYAYLGKVVYKAGVALVRFNDDGDCSNSLTPELKLIILDKYNRGGGAPAALMAH